jgi:peptidoglycan/xylan/chitin deacetylase (PgdA/CDA1 family)
MIYLILFLLFICLVLIIRHRALIQTENTLPVLMYHKISFDNKNKLTVLANEFESQLDYLEQNNYTTIHTSQLINFIENKTPLPSKPILITFDDGYKNNVEIACPILKKHKMKATLFLATNFIGKESSWDKEADPILSIKELKRIDSNTIELALHSHSHHNMQKESLEDIMIDFIRNINFFKSNKLNFSPAFAYPYGSRPKNRVLLKNTKDLMSKLGIKLAFRIGNRINKIPFKDIFEINRIEISGFDSIKTFEKKLKYGNRKFF